MQEYSFTLKSVSDANRIRAHVEARLDAYKQSGNKADATFVIGGGGLTGIELVGEFADLLPAVCQEKGIDFKEVSLYTVEAGPFPSWLDSHQSWLNVLNQVLRNVALTSSLA